jgi:adenosylcobinamide kinase / adenosylcobinamide-phosphate guanylyltransferase
MGTLTLILGGARSGKSTYAEKLAAEAGGSILYVATAEAGDEEMAARIKKHKRERPLNWRTLELPAGVGRFMTQYPVPADLVLVDCLTLLVTNVLLAASPDPDYLDEAAGETAVAAEINELLHAIQQSQSHWIIVSNEVGLGLVPPYPLGRLYRDALGRANQQLAQAADHVTFMVAGLPLHVK